MELEVCRMFRSIQGESTYAGVPCSFIRLAGCNLRCRHCDTRQSWEPGERIDIEDILAQVETYGCNLVEITGGEPLIQGETPSLAWALLERGHKVLVETNGSLDIALLPEGVIRVMDIKCPSSGETDKMLWDNLFRLTPEDEVKFVIADRHDYEWARGIVRERFDKRGAKVLFSTVFGEVLPRMLAEWMLDDGVEVRFQLQLHKYIWPKDNRER